VWNDTANERSRQSIESSGGRQFVEEQTRTVASSANHRQTPAALLALNDVLRANHMNPAMPLSAASYDAWRRSVAEAHNEVNKIKLADGHDAFTVRTFSGGQVKLGAIIEASLVVRSNDWHPVEERLRVKGSEGEEEFELSETAYSVVSLSSLAREIFA